MNIIEVDNEFLDGDYYHIDAYGTETGTTAAIVNKYNGKVYYSEAKYINHPLIKESIAELLKQLSL